jgi:hypothetical protein
MNITREAAHIRHNKEHHSSLTATTTHQKTTNKHYGVHLKLKSKSRRRRTSQELIQEEKDKPGAEPGGEGLARS